MVLNGNRLQSLSIDSVSYTHLDVYKRQVYRGREYRLATYRGVRIVEASSRRLVLRQGRYLLEASFAAREAHPLRAPRTDGMTRTIRECNRARARFRFWEGGGLVFDLCSENASLECEEAVPDGAKRRGALL